MVTILEQLGFAALVAVCVAPAWFSKNPAAQAWSLGGWLIVAPIAWGILGSWVAFYIAWSFPPWAMIALDTARTRGAPKPVSVEARATSR